MHNNNYNHPYGQPGHPAGYPGSNPGYPNSGYPQAQGHPNQHLYPNLPVQNLSYESVEYTTNLSYPSTPGQPGWQPSSNPGYPGASAPPASQFLPTISPTRVSSGIEWVPALTKDAYRLTEKAVVGGYEAHDGSPLWIIRSRFHGDTLPGKMPIQHKVAYVPWGGEEHLVHEVEVLCAPPEKIRWVQWNSSIIPQKMIPGGQTSDGEPLFIGRVKEQGSLTPGKIHLSHGVLYISFAGKEIPHRHFEVLCHC